jgi:hypothetical protein
MGVGAYRQNHKERYAALVFNTLLGGSMSSRLFQNVREKRGLAYSVGSGLSAFRDAGLLSIYAGCSNQRVDEVVRVIMDELRAVVAAPIDEPELVRAKDNVKGSLILGLESTWQRAAYLARQEIYFGEPFTRGNAGRHRCREARGRRARGPGTADADARVGGRRGRCGRLDDCQQRAAGGVMIARYTHPEMGGIWSDEHRYATWLKVEIAAAEAMAGQGIVPAEAARAIRERGDFDIARIEAIEEVTRHDIIAHDGRRRVGPDARWLHFGLTSSDVLDTALALQMQDARVPAARGVRAASGRALEHAARVVGCTRAHANPRRSAKLASVKSSGATSSACSGRDNLRARSRGR